MTEKILKLINSPVFEDIYIGVKLLDNLAKKDCLRFLRRNFTKSENVSWIFHFPETKKVPSIYDAQYIQGKNYHYSMETTCIIVDNKKVTKWTLSNFKDQSYYKIVESWI